MSRFCADRGHEDNKYKVIDRRAFVLSVNSRNQCRRFLTRQNVAVVQRAHARNSKGLSETCGVRSAIADPICKLVRMCNQPAHALNALDGYLFAPADGRAIKIESQRIATQFVKDVERTEARGRRQSAAVNELTLRLIETQAETQRIACQVSRNPLT